MIFKIFCRPEIVPPPEITLRLVSFGDSVSLAAVDPAGKEIACGYLLHINKAGTISRNERVNPALGFQLDSQGRIKFSN